MKKLPFSIALGTMVAMAALARVGAASPSASGPGEGTGPYFDQKLPGKTPTIFAPGIVSLPGTSEMRIVFSPKGDECFFGRSSANGEYPWKLYYAKRVNDVWSTPALAPFHPDKGKFTGQPFFSADGKRLYFTSDANGEADIWVVERTPEGGWESPQILPAPLTSDAGDVYYSETLDGTAYFASNRPGGKGELDVWLLRRTDGRPLPAENLSALNAPDYEFDPCIDPHGRYLVFVGSDGLMVSYNDGQGGLKTPINMNTFLPGINDRMADSPSFSPDGKYFFWRLRNGKEGDLYWIENPIPAVDPGIPEK